MSEMIEIPNKSSFKINEVCALTGVKSYVLRFWESEFTEISPLMSSSGIKLYEHKDIEAILLIKKLLFDNKYSIEKAKAEMKRLMPAVELVERSFTQEYDSEDFDDHFFEDTFSQSNNVPNSPNNSESNLSQVKLLSAKSKLVQILNLTDRLNQKNNW